MKDFDYDLVANILHDALEDFETRVPELYNRTRMISRAWKLINSSLHTGQMMGALAQKTEEAKTQQDVDAKEIARDRGRIFRSCMHLFREKRFGRTGRFCCLCGKEFS